MMDRAYFHRPHTARNNAHQVVNGSSSSPATQQQQPPRLNEVFVGDLSFFCVEDDLKTLFSTYGQVVSVRIVRSDESNRSRTFGFVGMQTMEEAQFVAKALDNSYFMGRRMKVELTAFKHLQKKTKDPGYEVHVAFTAAASVGQLNEVLLSKVFCAYGNVMDVVVRDYHINELGEQTGYGFATFPDLESAMSVIVRCTSFFPLPGLHLRCTPGHRVQKCIRQRREEQDNHERAMQQQLLAAQQQQLRRQHLARQALRLQRERELRQQLERQQYYEQLDAYESLRSAQREQQSYYEQQQSPHWALHAAAALPLQQSLPHGFASSAFSSTSPSSLLSLSSSSSPVLSVSQCETRPRSADDESERERDFLFALRESYGEREREREQDVSRLERLVSFSL